MPYKRQCFASLPLEATPCLQKRHSPPLPEQVPEGSESARALLQGARWSWETRCTKTLRSGRSGTGGCDQREHKHQGTFLFFPSFR